MSPPDATGGSRPTADIGSHRILRVSNRKWYGVLAIGAGFVVIGIILIVTSGGFLSWFATLFFGLVAAVALMQLTGHGTELELDTDTFTLRNFGRITTERWDDCADFSPYRSGNITLVAYDRARDIGTHTAEMNRMLTGRTAALPDNFGLEAAALAGLMNGYQAAAVDRSWADHPAAVAALKSKLQQDLEKTGIAATVVTAPEEMDLPDDMTPWPSALVISKTPHPDGSRHILVVAEVLSPASKWIEENVKRRDAFETLNANALQIVNPVSHEVKQILAGEDR